MAGEAIVTVQGNLGADAELRLTPNGKTVTSFSVGNTPRIQKNNEWIDGETVWFRCFVWGKDATGAANELRKGSRVFVTGRFSLDNYIDKEGKERKTLQINVDNYGITPRNVVAELPIVNPNIIIEDPVDDIWG
jgi:single-strand DNA-binding protein